MIGCVKVMFDVDVGICVLVCVKIVFNIVLFVMFLEIRLSNLMSFPIGDVFTKLPAVAPSVAGVLNKFVCTIASLFPSHVAF